MDYLSEGGTLLMPGLSYLFVTKDNPVFHLQKTHSCVGILPETFRQMEGVLRSLHPTHSVCGWGKHAQQLLCRHSQDKTPVGPHSPFRLLPEKGGKILMMGCSLNTNTSMHGVEEWVGTEYVLGEPLEYVLLQEDHPPQNKTYQTHGFQAWLQRYDRIQYLPPGDWLKKGSILSAKSWLIDAIELWKYAAEKLQEDMLFFVEAEEKYQHDH